MTLNDELEKTRNEVIDKINYFKNRIKVWEQVEEFLRKKIE